MNVDVLTEIDIDCSRERVFAYAADPDHAPEWYVNIKSVHWHTAPPLRVGSRVAFVAHFLGRRLAYTYEIVQLVQDELLVMRTADGPFPMETTYTFTSNAPNRTHVTLRNRGNPKGFGIAVAPVLVLAMRRANRRDLEHLKKNLERNIGVATNAIE
jgi:uncharacterized protein YndB with AHSA1/START domain